MKISEIARLVDAKVFCDSGEDTEIRCAFACDMMSDVLAYVKNQAVLVTGLVNPQVIRTAEMMDIVCIVFVRDKRPDEDMIELAKERGIAILATGHRMFGACGILYTAGLRGGTDYERYDHA